MPRTASNPLAWLIEFFEQMLGVVKTASPARAPAPVEVTIPSLMAILIQEVYPEIGRGRKKYTAMSAEEKYNCMRTILQVMEVYSKLVDTLNFSPGPSMLSLAHICRALDPSNESLPEWSLADTETVIAALKDDPGQDDKSVRDTLHRFADFYQKIQTDEYTVKSAIIILESISELLEEHYSGAKWHEKYPDFIKDVSKAYNVFYYGEAPGPKMTLCIKNRLRTQSTASSSTVETSVEELPGDPVAEDKLSPINNLGRIDAPFSPRGAGIFVSNVRGNSAAAPLPA